MQDPFIFNPKSMVDNDGKQKDLVQRFKICGSWPREWTFFGGVTSRYVM